MSKPESHDAYIATVREEFRPLLTDMRARLAALLPGAIEVISYAMPGFRVGKNVIAGYAGHKNHCSIYPHSGSIIPLFEFDIRALGMTCTKSALHFTAEKPIPQDLLARIVAARLTEADHG